jgi:AcrR family transcriptional regulator
MKTGKSAARRGRPRAFDVDKALDRAVQVFWRKGYDGTSITDLTQAMGIERPSLYAAFGNKESLFRKALDRYANGPSAFVREALKEPTARAVVERLMQGVINTATDPRNPPGCLLVHGALSCGGAADCIQQELAARRASNEASLRKRFRRAIAEGDLPPDADADALARYIATVNLGMAVQAATGATRAELLRVVKTVLRNWPR